MGRLQQLESDRRQLVCVGSSAALTSVPSPIAVAPPVHWLDAAARAASVAGTTGRGAGRVRASWSAPKGRPGRG